MISKEFIEQLIETADRTIQAAIAAIYEYQKAKTYMPKYYKYPEAFLKGIEEHESYKEMEAKIPAFNCGIKFFTNSTYQPPANYGELLRGSDGQFQINCHSLESFDELLRLFKSVPDASKALVSEEKYIDSAIVSLVANITNRYLYITKKFKTGDYDSELTKSLIAQQLTRLYAKNLSVNICVPICFMTFEADETEIAEGISILKMSQDFQMSRYNATHFESTQESNVVQCALFMLKMSGYSINNDDREAMHNAIVNYWAYPTEIIDDFFAAIRVAVGCKTGYGQLLVEPIGWADKWTTDLPAVYGANVYSFNHKEVETKLFGYSIYNANNNDLDLIKTLFTTIRQKRMDSKHNKSFRKVFIAIQRLNRCMLREEDDDTALDAIIGIEALLSGDTQGEITYTISNRISVVAAKLERCPYSPQDMRRAMKTIYGFRSDIVHGRDTKKNGMIAIDGKQVESKKLAVEFLRYSLLFIIGNQEYLDVKEFESALDNAVSNNDSK